MATNFLRIENMNKEIKYFVLQANTDRTEGRGPRKDIAFFKKREDAVEVSQDPRYYKNYGVMGTPGDPKYDVVEKEISVYDSALEFWTDHDPVVKTALEKLTKEELIALGIKKS